MSNRHKQPRTSQKDRHAERVKAYAALFGALVILIPAVVDAVLKLHLV